MSASRPRRAASGSWGHEVLELDERDRRWLERAWKKDPVPRPAWCSATACASRPVCEIHFVCYANRARTRSSPRRLYYCQHHARRFAIKHEIAAPASLVEILKLEGDEVVGGSRDTGEST